MASPRQDVPPPVRCAENIALLELLDTRPDNPNVSALQQPLADRRADVQRSLSLNQERELATNLAFLAAISDDFKHIMAVCIEEVPELGGCQVLVAINKKMPTSGEDTTSGDEILNKVQRGFQQIFGRLREMPPDETHLRESKVADEDTVFNDIVALCHWRILSRLRSRKSKASLKSQKRFIGLHLQDFIEVPWHNLVVDRGDPRMTIAQLSKYRQYSKTLLESLDALEAADVVRHEDLSRLVRYIAWFMKAVPLAKLLGLLRDQDMAPSSRDWLLNCLLKVARYRECARLLCSRARRIPMLRNITVRKVENAAQTRGQTPQVQMTICLDHSLRRFQYKGKPVQIKTLPDWLQKTVGSSKDSFSDNVQANLQNAKVHAEIQLLAHYEEVKDGVIPPRIIAATKDACSLCHSFIRLHGTFELPRTHGRLYGKWRLPAIYQDGPLQQSLNSYLEGQISATLQRLLPLPKRPLIIFANESNISLIDISATTLAASSSILGSSNLVPQLEATISPFKDDATGRKGDQPTSNIDHTIPSEESRNDNAADGVSGQRERTDETITTESGGEDNHNAGAEVLDQERIADAQAYASKSTSDASRGDSRGDASDSPMASDSQSLPEQILKPGQTITFKALPDGNKRFRTNGMNISIDDSSSRCSLRWLSEAEAQATLCANTDAVLDVESISSGVDMTLTKDAEGNTYFAYGKEVVMIRALMTHDSSS